LDECGDVGILRACEEVPFPVAGDRAVLDRGRALTDRHGVDDLTARLPLGARPLRAAHRPPRAQMPNEFLLEHAAGLDEEAAADGLVGDLELLLVRIPPLQPAGDLLGRPLQTEFPGHDSLQSPMDRQPTPLRTPGAFPGHLVRIARSVSRPATIARNFATDR